MDNSFFGPDVEFGTPELQLPVELREPLRLHLEQLRERSYRHGLGTKGRIRPAARVAGNRPGPELDKARWTNGQSRRSDCRIDVPNVGFCQSGGYPYFLLNL